MIRKSSTIKYINGHSKLRDLQTSSFNDILVLRQKKMIFLEKTFSLRIYECVNQKFFNI